ncbi:hypothetical protein PRZ48_003326 [Zasmidium cellare]|uniref:DUF7053 domain-containing protein n=1 Tax=Zasmidium cellare TaxID=395010 RepID=A0ABR0EWB2_ZASCE|nr:hypothetical protein PRZ48_003326 [Zasmidium cellare]
MVGLFETTFTYASQSQLPPNVSVEAGLKMLHDFDVIIRLSPDCRGCKRVPTPKHLAKPHNRPANGDGPFANGINEHQEIQCYEVEEDLTFIPKRLWSGGVKYLAEFLPTADGCDITVHAPGGFTSTNHWRLLREMIPEDEPGPVIERVQSKDLAHAQMMGEGWYVQIVSDARCNKTFAGFVKGFIKNSQTQLQMAFIEKLQASPAEQRKRRPTLGRRRSSEF